MQRNHIFIFPLALAFGIGSFAGWAQQPAPPPPVDQAEGWRKFSSAQPVTIPGMVTAPAGTWITIRMNDVISTDRNVAGDVFTATLTQPLIADGIVVARRGQTVGGRVAEVVKGGRVKGTARLGLELTEVSLVDGRQVAVRTQLIGYSSGRSYGRDAAAVGYTTASGAAIGAMVDGGRERA